MTFSPYESTTRSLARARQYLEADIRPAIASVGFTERWRVDLKTGLSFVFFVALLLVLTVHHEPWRDESDAWLTARDESFAGLIRLSSHSGTPVLWYLTQAPFAKAGLPYAVQGYLHALIAALAAGLLLFRAPFPFVLRLVLVFGYYLSFEYAVIARNYSSGIMLCFTALAMDAARLRFAPLYGLIVALSASASAHFTVFAVALLVPLTWEAIELRTDRRVWLGVAIGSIGIAFALWQLWPRPGGQMPAELFHRFDLLQIPRMLGRAFTPRDTRSTGVIVGLLAVALLGMKLRTAPRAAAFFAMCCAGLAYIFVAKYARAERHYGLFLIAIVCALWLAERSPQRPSSAAPLISRRAFMIGMVLLLLPSTTMAVRVWNIELAYPFSGAAEMARFIHEKRLDQARIAVHQPMSSVLPYLSRRTFWYPGVGEEGSHMKWDANYAAGWRMSVSEAIARVKAQCSGWQDPLDPVLVLLNEPIPRHEAKDFRLVYQTGQPWAAVDEMFFLYAPATVELGRALTSEMQKQRRLRCSNNRAVTNEDSK